MNETTGKSWTIKIPQPVFWAFNTALFGLIAFALFEGWGVELTKPVFLVVEDKLAPPPESAGSVEGMYYALTVLMLAGLVIALNIAGMLVAPIIAVLSAIAFLWTSWTSIARLRANDEG